MSGSAIIFDTADPVCDPEGLISKFVQYESFRIHRDRQEEDMSGRLAERMNVLFWYLGDYISERHYDYVVPLSAQQISFLNSPAPIAGASPAVTIALHNFVLREMPAYSNLTDPDVLGEAVYWWCTEKAPRSKFDRSLVTDEQVALLRTEVQGLGEQFALNRFMVHFLTRHDEFESLDMRQARDRAAFFYFLVLYAFANPHILKFIPRDALRRVLQEKNGAPSSLDSVIARFCFTGRQSDDIAAARELRRLGETALRRAGLRLERDSPPLPPGMNTGECLLPPAPSLGPPELGIAVIGPAFKTSGLGQAMRLSVEVLSLCENVAPSVYNFDLDNPAPTGFASTRNFAPFVGNREINLIHLNAEMVPLVYAFEPEEMYRESYNIGYFFWELNVIPKCHHLALELLDEIWVSSEYNRETYARFANKPVINVGMAVEPLPEVEPTPRAEVGLDEDSFVFLTTFDSFSFIERKNPLGVLEAFRRAFPLGTEPARLVLKTQNRFRVSDPHQLKIWKRIDAAVRADPRVMVINETYAYRDLLGLKRTCDCYVSLHRSEGLGFGMLEAMQLGMPVIATGYSGNMEFCSPDTALMVEYSLISVVADEYIYAPRGSVWAEPSIASAAEHMRRIMVDHEAAERRAQVAKALVQRDFSIEGIARRYAARLAEIRAETATRKDGR